MADLPDEKGNASAQDVPPQQLTPGPQTGASHKSSEGVMPQCSHETIKEKTVVHDVAPEHESPHEDTDDDTHDDHDTDDESHASSDAPNVRVSTRSSSTHSRPVSIIPRFKRRGLLGSLTIVPEVDRPYDYSRNTKWMLTCVVSLAGAVAPFGSSIFYPALGIMSEEFHTTQTITNLSIAMYMIAMSIFPLWWSSFSEEFGRRSIYVIAFALFVIFSVLSAVSTNIAMLIVMRLLGGGASASVQAVGAGTIADIWEVRERGKAMGIFYLGPLLGPLLGPIIGGVLAQDLGWRSTMWFLTGYGGVILVLIILCLPETLAVKTQPLRPTSTRESTASSISVHAKRGAEFMRRVFLNPFRVIAMLRFPPILLTVVWAAVTFGSLYVVNISVQNAYSKPPYSFKMIIVGLFYIPPSLGYILASLFGGRWIDHIMIRQARKAGRYDARGKLIYLPEERFAENAWTAGTMYPLALIFYGWTIQKGLHWIVPSIGGFFFGVGSMLVFAAATTALTEFMPRRGSEGVAVNNFVRNILSCVGAIIAEPVISAIGNGWTFTILGIFSLILSYLCIWLMRTYSQKWRKQMDEHLEKTRTR
ncbi:hypothetical protein jhhlp_006224 [Lomentospora prolificans]|uniref:Major facilitator superfamily (MFS) profile domain-containing protein n=1 Tax=Lomentospora prolificans TaxID=41688 RepID=A0A2N3N5B2_9PEZI|nr:hypothetical protein jhhlp_006224 [Lomentospora prolificans]